MNAPNPPLYLSSSISCLFTHCYCERGRLWKAWHPFSLDRKGFWHGNIVVFDNAERIDHRNTLTMVIKQRHLCRAINMRFPFLLQVSSTLIFIGAISSGVSFSLWLISQLSNFLLLLSTSFFCPNSVGNEVVNRRVWSLATTVTPGAEDFFFAKYNVIKKQ